MELFWIVPVHMVEPIDYSANKTKHATQRKKN